MGQYYNTIRIKEKPGRYGTDYEAEIYPSYLYGGQKLMEFAYIGNAYADGVSRLAEPFRYADEPEWTRLAVVGDYADPEAFPPGFMRDAVALRYSTFARQLERPLPMAYSLERSRCWVVNCDRMEKVRLFDLPPAWEENDVSINPLILLLAAGNGDNGGDYYRGFPSYDMVGRWAFERIMLLDEESFFYRNRAINLGEYREITPGFRESSA